MRLLLRRREEGPPAAQADAEALIRDYGADAYAEAPCTSVTLLDAGALAAHRASCARMTGKRNGVDTAARIISAGAILRRVARTNPSYS
jgi:hypothetical protein